MNNALFIILSFIYVFSLAFVDGLFNRLVFRENKKLPYSSKIKQGIYKLWEWKAIGIILLFILPIAIPFAVSYFLGGFYFLKIYLLVLLIVPWDIVFGKLVFDDYFGDTPSIALPFIGWFHMNLRHNLFIRLILILLILFFW